MNIDSILTIQNIKRTSVEVIKKLMKMSRMDLYAATLRVQNDLHIDDNSQYLATLPKWMAAKSVLDSGCGPGDMIGGLCHRYADKQYSGVDRNWLFILRAKKLLKSLTNCTFYRANLYKFAKGRYDFVILRAVLQHLSDPGRFMRRLPALLNEGAPVLFFETTRENFITADPSIPTFDEFYSRMEEVQKKHTGSRDCIAELERDLSQFGFRLLALDTPVYPVTAPENRLKVVQYLILACTTAKRLMRMPIDLERLLADLLHWYEAKESQLSLKSRRMLIERM